MEKGHRAVLRNHFFAPGAAYENRHPSAAKLPVSTSGPSQKHIKASKKSLRKHSVKKYKFGLNFEVIWGAFRVLETILVANCEPKIHQKAETNVSNGSQKSVLVP